MPPLGYPLSIGSAVAASSAITVSRSGIRLRRQTAAGYDPSANFPAAGEYVTFPNLTGTGIASLWGFQVQAVLNDGTLDFQLSEDDGVTWRYWDGGAWAMAGAADWTLPLVVATNIGAFPLGGGTERGVRLRMRLRPDATAKQTPVVEDVWFLAEYDHDPVVDVLRTVRRGLAALRCRLYVRESADGTGLITLVSHDFDVDAGLGIEVFNLTDDPGRQTDLFSAYDAGTGVVTLTAAQDVDDQLEVRYQGSAPVVLVADAWFFVSRVPSIEVRVSVDVDEDQSVGVTEETNEGTSVGRTRWGPRYLAVVATVRCVDKDQERAASMAKEVRRFLHEDYFTSLATGQVWPTADVSGYAPSPILGDGIFAPSISVRLWVREDYETFTSAALATAINLRVTATPEDEWNERVWYDETAQVT